MELRELLAARDDVLVLGDLVALDDVLVRYFLAVGLADAFVVNARLVLVVEHVKPDFFRRDGREELHRNVDETEAHAAGPDRSCHAARSFKSRATPSSVDGDC